MIWTKRLLIRRVCRDDWKSIQAIWAEVNKTPYAQYDRPNDTDDALVMERIGIWASFAESGEHRFYAVCLNDRVIGFVALHQREDSGGVAASDVGGPETGAVYEIGYSFHPAYHGKGYAKESISRILALLASEGAAFVEAGTALANTPSVRLLASLGFTLVRTEKVSFYKDENGRDIVFDGGIFVWRPQGADVDAG